jgi:hypothetical protein
MIVVVMLGIIGTALTSLLIRQQRFHAAVATMADARARMRDISTILPTDLRSISSAGQDILTYDLTSMQFRAFTGTTVLCTFATTLIIDIPPKTLNSGNVLTSWINPPVANDVAFIYDDGANAGNADDSWKPYTITAVTSAVDATWCPVTNVPAYTTALDATATRYRLTLGTAPNQATTHVGAPIRLTREVKYSVYQGADNQWYVGYQTCTPNATFGLAGTCGTVDVLAGPVLPATTDAATSGLSFLYYDMAGNALTAAADKNKIARIDVGIRTTSSSLRANSSTAVAGDSLKFTIGIRNRV